jgi:outer membrane lipoprotein carrier protein
VTLSGRLATLLVAATTATASLASGQTSAGAAPPPAELARLVQQRYDRVQDFEADFTQTYEGGVLKTRTTERGTVVIKRPGKMRWVYTAPERKEFVSDGARIFAYFPADKQVVVSPAPTGSDTTPALFLTGRADLVRDFTAEAIDLPAAPPGTIGLKLVPRKADPDFEWLAVAVDPGTYQIQQLVALDRQGGRSTFTFRDLRENRRPSDNVFVFRIPKGVDVITNDGRTP